jgi:uncharacterized membrane protein
VAEKVPRDWDRVDAHHRFLISCGVALLVLAGLHGHAAVATQLVVTWIAFAGTTIGLILGVMLARDPYEVRRNASQQDGSRTFLFIAVVTAATISVFAVFILLGSAKDLPAHRFALHVTLSVGAIVLSWVLVHLLFAIRYAHYYYFDAHTVEREKIDGGLIFPDDKNPDYQDFAYFSFVVGMTCQVSDVQISAKEMRRLALVHGLISFVFNTAILATFVNIIAGLL